MVRVCFLFQGLGDVVHAADGGQNPQLVAHAHAAVLAGVAHEGGGLSGLVGRPGGIPGVLQLAGEVGVQVMHVDVGTGSYVFLGIADGEAVLDNVLTLLDVTQGNLVAGGDVAQRGDGNAVHGEHSALFNSAQGNGDVVLGDNTKQFSHGDGPPRKKRTGVKIPGPK